jgi:hypothetical protein
MEDLNDSDTRRIMAQVKKYKLALFYAMSQGTLILHIFLL